MTTYLLLRDNKESGPYSFDEIKAKGLKAYDLVWIEGKSAAWRYPCEVAELSSFAPAVEEQPFDRFFKRPSPEKTAVTATVQEREAPAGPGEPSSVPGKKIIYVTLPACKSIPVSTGKAYTPAAYEQSSTNAKAHTPSPYEPSAVTTGKVYQPALPGQIPASRAFEDKPAQPSKEWHSDVEIVPRTSAGSRDRSRFLQPVLVTACVLALLAAGIFIGLSINKNSLGYPQKILAGNNPVTPVHSANPPALVGQTAGHAAASSTNPVPPIAVPVSVDTTSTIVKTTNPTVNEIKAGDLKKRALANNTKEKVFQPAAKKSSVITTPSLQDSTGISLPVVHREASHRPDIPGEKVDKEAIRNNLSSLVSVGANTYAVGPFGGISGVQLTVTNKSVYSLDLVVVEIQYIQANKKVFKTENLYFRDINPGTALMLEAPASTRGIKVQCRITLVNSKELGSSYSTR